MTRISKVFCKQENIFKNNVVERARKNTNVHGLFYNNSIECQHYLEKKEQSFRKGIMEDIIKEDEDVRAI